MVLDIAGGRGLEVGLWIEGIDLPGVETRGPDLEYGLAPFVYHGYVVIVDIVVKGHGRPHPSVEEESVKAVIAVEEGRHISPGVPLLQLLGSVHWLSGTNDARVEGLAHLVAFDISGHGLVEAVDKVAEMSFFPALELFVRALGSKNGLHALAQAVSAFPGLLGKVVGRAVDGDGNGIHVRRVEPVDLNFNEVGQFPVGVLDDQIKGLEQFRLVVVGLHVKLFHGGLEIVLQALLVKVEVALVLGQADYIGHLHRAQGHIELLQDGHRGEGLLFFSVGQTTRSQVVEHATEGLGRSDLFD